MELIKALGIDGKLFFAQMINFLILLLILYKFLYKPVLKVMRERTERIEKGLEEAKRAEERAKRTNEDYQEKIAQARAHAQEIIKEAQAIAEESKKEITNKAREESEKIILRAKEEISIEKEKMLKEVKNEMSDLVLLAVRQILEHNLDKKTEKKFINQVLEAIKK